MTPAPYEVVTTDRLHLVPLDGAQAAALGGGNGEGAGGLAEALGVRGPGASAAWPPEMFAEHLEALAEATEAGGEEEWGWWCWAIVQHAEAVDHDEATGQWELEALGEGPRLAGLAVFLGPPIPNPDDNDALETSLAIALVDDLTGYGLGSETLRALSEWAFDKARGASRPDRLLGDVLANMEAAKHMLRKCGFRRMGAGEEPGSEVYCLERHR